MTQRGFEGHSSCTVRLFKANKAFGRSGEQRHQAAFLLAGKSPFTHVPAPVNYELVRLANGTFSVRSRADAETFHPVAGPVAEAEALYVRQLRLPERAAASRDEFVIWDVGLGAGGNALTAIRSLGEVNTRLRIVSFDRTLEALTFATQHAAELEFPLGFESELRQLIEGSETHFQRGGLEVSWRIQLGDFPTLLASPANGEAAPHAIFFDAFSPARNPEMWTLPLFENLFRRLAPDRPCALATFSRSTLARTALLLAGFFVGAGEPVAGKEETTIAANDPTLLARPLDRDWLERARISRSAEPLTGVIYRQARLSETSWERLRAHAQFG